jgi:hypothetical protein
MQIQSTIRTFFNPCFELRAYGPDGDVVEDAESGRVAGACVMAGGRTKAKALVHLALTTASTAFRTPPTASLAISYFSGLVMVSDRE